MRNTKIPENEKKSANGMSFMLTTFSWTNFSAERRYTCFSKVCVSYLFIFSVEICEKKRVIQTFGQKGGPPETGAM